MTQSFETPEQIFSNANVPNVRAWIRESLERWFATGDGLSYRPYEHLFRNQMRAHEVLAKIYFSLGGASTTTKNRSHKGLFRRAVADLLLEPVTFELEPYIFEELLQLGSAIKANEIVEALEKLAEMGRLSGQRQIDDSDGNSIECNLYRSAIFTVVKGRFANDSTLKFFWAALGNISKDISLLPIVIENLLKFPEMDKFNIATQHANVITEYIESRYEFVDEEYCREDLKRIFNTSVAGANFEELTEIDQKSFAASSVAWLLDFENEDSCGERSQTNEDNTAELERALEDSLDGEVPTVILFLTNLGISACRVNPNR